VHERYRRQTDNVDGRTHDDIANVNVSSRSLKTYVIPVLITTLVDILVVHTRFVPKWFWGMHSRGRLRAPLECRVNSRFSSHSTSAVIWNYPTSGYPSPTHVHWPCANHTLDHCSSGCTVENDPNDGLRFNTIQHSIILLKKSQSCDHKVLISLLLIKSFIWDLRNHSAVWRMILCAI